MGKTLFIKMLRDLRQNIVQFVAIFVMCFFAAYVFAGLDCSSEGINKSVDRYFTETNFMDISMVSEGFSQEDLSTVSAIKGVEDTSMYADITGRIKIGEEEKKIGMRFMSKDTISKMLLMDGEPYENGMSGVWIDWHFAERQHLSPGDRVTLKYKESYFDETIRGIVDDPDFYEYIVDDTYTEPNFGDYGYSFLDISEYPAKDIVYDRINVSVKDVDRQFDLTEQDIQEMENVKVAIMDAVSKNSLAVTTKNEDPEYVGIISDVDYYQTLGTVFPGMFILIAVLGVVTTMSRLMSRHRTLIGALKALGFSRFKITFHYMSYVTLIAALACISGSIIGYYTLGVSFIESEVEYHSNPYLNMFLSSGLIIINIVIILFSSFTAYMACRKLLVLNASDILRPEPPAQGQSSSLEKLPLWNLLSFASKWNIRDININRFRTVMGILGVALCSALMVSAIAMNDNMKLEGVWRYSELLPAEYNIVFKSSASPGTVYDYSRKYHGQMIMDQTVEMKSKSVQRLYNMVVLDKGNLYRLEDNDLNYIELPDDKISISVKAAKIMEVGIGDTISFRIPGQKKWYKVNVGEIHKTDGTQGIVLSRKLFESVQGEFIPNNVFTNMTVPQALIKDSNDIATVFSREDYLRSIRNTRAGVDFAVVIIMIIAMVVGVVVMYNLGVLSFMEKTREIATLKVLGFPTPKIRWILQQQNILITGLGVIIGLPLGVPLLYLMYIEDRPEVDYLVVINPGPFIISFILSFGLSVLVNIWLTSQVKDIDMVEALKGVE